MLPQFCVKLTVPGIDHADADFITINPELIDDIAWRNLWLIFAYFHGKAIVAEVREKFNGYSHLEVPEGINFLRSEIHHTIVRRQGLTVEKLWQPVICIIESCSLVKRPLCLQD